MAWVNSKIAWGQPTHPKPTPFNQEFYYLSIDLGDDVMMTHYDSIVKQIFDKNREKFYENEKIKHSVIFRNFSFVWNS